MPRETIIVGGGLAGLSAAAALADKGVSVTLLESRPRLGGRAGSFVDTTTGECIDNCQHVSLGCCTNFQHFCDSIGVSNLLRRERRLNFIGPDGDVDSFESGIWPAPFHLWPAFRRLSYLSPADHRQIVRGLRALARHNLCSPPCEGERQGAGSGIPVPTAPSRSPSPKGGSEASFEQWLREHDQSQTAIERFWHVVLVSALSETLDRIDVVQARKVFVDAFLAQRTGWQVQIPMVPLDGLYGAHLIEWFKDRGVAVHMKSGVQRLCLENNQVVAVELRNGERHTAEQFIVSVPHHRLLALLPESLRNDPRLADAAKLESAPISSVHLWFDRPITSLPHAVFVERLSQWMFNRTVLQGGEQRAESREPEKPSDAKNASPQLSALSSQLFYYQIVISASRNIAGRSQHEVIHEVVQELREIWPVAARAELLHSRLITEHRAVFSVQPGSERFRPAQQSPIPNLQLAGDWTQTGWPATMEGAVRSGYLAAENVLSNLGRPAKLLQPDLPASLLSKLLLGL